ncbi:uncharacterized protein LOC141958224 isoform X2 [Athene noctua]|uniref:uncharacterized protein LOC141958224 isoform X2 n=1 Tax=Athene noctua TaxID=126797 RepID=UPI003EBDF958
MGPARGPEVPPRGPGGEQGPAVAPPPGAMAGQTQEPVIFEDVAVYLSRAEWDAIAVEQKDLYCSVMLDNYELLTSLGYPGPKPDILFRLERGEEPWVCTPQSPVRWDGSVSPYPGHEGDMSWQKQPPSGWWPGHSGSCVLEERTQTPRQGGRCVHWRLRSRRLLNKFKCLKGRSELLSEAAGRGMRPLESRERAQAVFKPWKGGEAENKQGVMANVTQSKRFPLCPVMGQQNKETDPQEHLCGDPREKLQRTAQKSQHTLGEVTFLQGNGEVFVKDLNEIILEEHCYCMMGETRLLHYTQHLCALTEHNYHKNPDVGVLALKDHEYCQVPWFRYQGRVGKILHLAGKQQATFRRLAKRKFLIGKIIRKAKRIMWRCKSWVSKVLEFPQGSSSTRCLPEPAIPPAEAEDGPTEGTRGVFCPPAKQEAVPPQPQSRAVSQGVTSAALRTPVVCFEPTAAHPPSSAATEVKMEATHPEVSLCHKVQWAQLTGSPHPEQNVELLKSNNVSLHDAYKMVMWAVDHMLDSICQNLEHGGYSWCKDATWPVVIQTDS